MVYDRPIFFGSIETWMYILFQLKQKSLRTMSLKTWPLCAKQNGHIKTKEICMRKFHLRKTFFRFKPVSFFGIIFCYHGLFPQSSPMSAGSILITGVSLRGWPCLLLQLYTITFPKLCDDKLLISFFKATFVMKEPYRYTTMPLHQRARALGRIVILSRAITTKSITLKGLASEGKKRPISQFGLPNQ